MKLSNAKMNHAIKRFNQLGKELKQLAPEGSWGITSNMRTFYFGSKDNPQIFTIPTEKQRNKSIKVDSTRPKIKNILSMTRTLKDTKLDESLFIPYVTQSPLDGLFSNKGGIMPACNYIVIGDPGVGKTSILCDYVAQIPKHLFVSGEMDDVDMYEYGNRIENIKTLNTLYMSDVYAAFDYEEEPDLWAALEDICLSGLNVILIDSLKEVLDPICEQMKWSYKKAETKFVQLMNKANKEFRTSFVIIQQINKGGEFVGTNALKHNTTGMFEIRHVKGQEGVMRFSADKNRRGWKYRQLQYRFGEVGIEWDMEALDRLLTAERIMKEETQDFSLDDLFANTSLEETVES